MVVCKDMQGCLVMSAQQQQQRRQQQQRQQQQQHFLDPDAQKQNYSAKPFSSVERRRESNVHTKLYWKVMDYVGDIRRLHCCLSSKIRTKGSIVI
jgi:hemolysin activation/secretion protein